MFDISSHLATLPAGPHLGKTTDKYMFLDTRRVIDDMADLGYEATGFRRAKGRTVDAAYGLHEVEFMNPGHKDRSRHEAPRVLFMNSYDGSRRARFAAGLIRFACLNGLITGDLTANLTFTHIGDYEEALMGRMRSITEETSFTFDKIESYRDLELDRQIYLEMAREALAIRFPGAEELVIRPETMLMPRRIEDLPTDLYTTWNVVQENIIRGGVPGLNAKGDVKLSRPVGQLEKSNRINSELWGLLKKTAELV